MAWPIACAMNSSGFTAVMSPMQTELISENM